MIRRATIAAFVLGVVMNSGFVQAGPSTGNGSKDVASRIRTEIATLPYATIWDWIEAEVRPDGIVMLRGDVLRPSTKSDAEFRVRRIETVSNVINEINVLPLSRFDNDIRIAVYRSLFNWNSPLFRYGLGANPSIHIIVENGRVTLKGIVSNTMDKQLAAVFANRVSGVFNVDNQLQLESEL
jgi:hyperosmotically inducible protein